MAIHRVKINASIDYVAGHLRYGHYEGLINLNDEEFKDFEKNPIEFLINKDNFNLNFVVDDYCIEDMGEICNVEYNDLSAI